MLASYERILGRKLGKNLLTDEQRQAVASNFPMAERAQMLQQLIDAEREKMLADLSESDVMKIEAFENKYGSLNPSPATMARKDARNRELDDILAMARGQAASFWKNIEGKR